MSVRSFAQVASTPHLFRTLVHSFCPAIFGHEVVKAGLCLALFGGVQKNIGDRQVCVSVFELSE